MNAHDKMLAWCRKARNDNYQPVMRSRPDRLVIKGRKACAVLDAAFFSMPVIVEGNTWEECWRQLEVVED
jgi:hypothetical protein